MKYKIITTAVVPSAYEVEAGTKEQAEEKFWDGDHKYLGFVDSNEEIVDLKKCDCAECSGIPF